MEEKATVILQLVTEEEEDVVYGQDEPDEDDGVDVDGM